MLAATLVATAPLSVAAALSARPYALSALAATACVAALVRWLGDGGVRWLWWFCLAAVVTLLLQLFAVLVPLAVLVAACAVRPALFRGAWRALIAPLGLVLAAALSVAILGAGQRRQIAWIPSLFEGRQLITALTGPASGEHALYAIVVLGLAVVAAALCARAWKAGSWRPARLDLELLAVLLSWAVLPTAILAITSLVRPVFVDRYVTASVPALALAVALLATRAFGLAIGRWAERPRAIAVGAMLAISAAVVWFACSVPAAKAVYRSAPPQGASSGVAIHSRGT